MNGTLVLVLIGVAIAITYFVMRSEMTQQEKRWKGEKELLERKVEAYNEYLTKTCNYETPFHSCNNDLLARNPMVGGYGRYHMFMSECYEYEAEHENARVDGYVEIDGVLYDLRESKYNKLMIENCENREKMLDYRLKIYLCELVYAEMEKEHQKEFEKAWKKITKRLGVEGVLTNYRVIIWGTPIRDEVIDVERCIKNAERFSKNKKVSEEKIAELEDRAKRQKLCNEFVMDFNRFLEHENCSDKKCYKKGGNSGECRKLRKRFKRY